MIELCWLQTLLRDIRIASGVTAAINTRSQLRFKSISDSPGIYSYLPSSKKKKEIWRLKIAYSTDDLTKLQSWRERERGGGAYHHGGR